MNHPIILTQLEFVLLQLVAKGEGKWSWYEIAQALSRLEVPRTQRTRYYAGIKETGSRRFIE